MKRIVLFYIVVVVLMMWTIKLNAFSQVPVNFSAEVNKEIYETVELVYRNTNEMRKSSLYVDVSEDKDYELAFMVDSRDVTRSDFTIMSLRQLTSSTYNNRLFVIRIDRDKKMYLIGEDNLLTVEDIIKKQSTILGFIREFKAEIGRKLYSRNIKEDAISRKFMELK